MNDKILLAQTLKTDGRVSFDGLYDIDDNPVSIVIDKSDDEVILLIYKDIEDDEEYDDFNDDEYIQGCKYNEGIAPEQHDINKSAQVNMRGNCVVHAVHCEDCLREKCSQHDDCSDCPIRHCCERIFPDDE